MRGKWLAVPIVALVLIALAAIPLVQRGNAASVPVKSKPSWVAQRQDPYAEVTIGETVVYARLALTSQDRSKGLSGTERLEPDEGMIFQFPERASQAFWMKDMLFAIDMIWIDGDKVVEVMPDRPAPVQGAPETSLPIYQGAVPVTHVLEVNAGWAASHNIVAGAPVTIVFPEGVVSR